MDLGHREWSLGEVKKKLQAFGISSVTPGLAGEERLEELIRRLEEANKKVDATALTKNPESQDNSVTHTQNQGNLAMLQALEFSEIRSRLVALGESTSTPGLSGEDRKNELLRRLVKSICDSNDPNQRPISSRESDNAKELHSQTDFVSTPFGTNTETDQHNDSEMSIGDMKKELKRLGNKRAIAIAARFSGASQDKQLKDLCKLESKIDAEITRVKLLKPNEKAFSALVDDGSPFPVGKSSMLLARLEALKSSNKDHVLTAKQRIREEEEANPQYGVAAEERLQAAINSAAQESNMGRIRKKLEEHRIIDKKISIDIKQEPNQVKQTFQEKSLLALPNERPLSGIGSSLTQSSALNAKKQSFVFMGNQAAAKSIDVIGSGPSWDATNGDEDNDDEYFDLHFKAENFHQSDSPRKDSDVFVSQSNASKTDRLTAKSPHECAPSSVIEQKKSNNISDAASAKPKKPSMDLLLAKLEEEERMFELHMSGKSMNALPSKANNVSKSASASALKDTLSRGQDSKSPRHEPKPSSASDSVNEKIKISTVKIKETSERPSLVTKKKTARDESPSDNNSDNNEDEDDDDDDIYNRKAIKASRLSSALTANPSTAEPKSLLKSQSEATIMKQSSFATSSTSTAAVEKPKKLSRGISFAEVISTSIADTNSNSQEKDVAKVIDQPNKQLQSAKPSTTESNIQSQHDSNIYDLSVDLSDDDDDSSFDDFPAKTSPVSRKSKDSDAVARKEERHSVNALDDKPAVINQAVNVDDEDAESEGGNSDSEDDDEEQIKALLEHAKVLEGLNDISSADMMYTRALELDPLSIHTLSKYASFLHRKRGELARAEAFFVRALQICLPDFAKSIEKSIKAMDGKSDFNNSPSKNKEISSDVHTKVKSVVNLLLDFGVFLSRAKGDIDSAMKLYRKAIELSPNSGRVLASVAHFLGQEGGSVSESVELFAAAVKAEPQNALFLVRYARMLRKTGKIAEAELMYIAALKHAEGNLRLHPMAICNYATFLYQQRKNIDAARDLFNSGLQMYPKHKGLLKNLSSLNKQLVRKESKKKLTS